MSKIRNIIMVYAVCLPLLLTGCGNNGKKSENASVLTISTAEAAQKTSQISDMAKSLISSLGEDEGVAASIAEELRSIGITGINSIEEIKDHGDTVSFTIKNGEESYEVIINKQGHIENVKEKNGKVIFSKAK